MSWLQPPKIRFLRKVLTHRHRIKPLLPVARSADRNATAAVDERHQDEDGNLIDVRLSKTGDMAGTKAFFTQAIELHEAVPEKVATDGLSS